jgi:RecJ-like exonuclease
MTIQADTEADLDEDALTAFQVHQASKATTTHSTSALKTNSTTKTIKVETAVRLVSAFASSVM